MSKIDNLINGKDRSRKQTDKDMADKLTRLLDCLCCFTDSITVIKLEYFNDEISDEELKIKLSDLALTYYEQIDNVFMNDEVL